MFISIPLVIRVSEYIFILGLIYIYTIKLRYMYKSVVYILFNYQFIIYIY